MIFALILLISSSLAAISGEQRQRRSEPKPSPSPTKQTVHSPLPAPTGHVNDLAHALNDDTREQLEQALVELQKRSKIDFVVALVNTTNGLPIFDYSKSVFQGWNVGGTGDGILLFLAIDDHQWRLHTTRGLTRDLPEEKIKEVGALMNPLLGQDQYGNGLRRGVEAIVKALAAKRGFAPISIPAPLLPS